jgi:DNA replication and repair protein RecF
VLELGSVLVESRLELLAALEPGFAATADELGLPDAQLVYEGESPIRSMLETAIDRDLDRGTTGVGPHLHDVRIVSGERDLRAFGSQGEQRLAVLALLLAEAALIADRRGYAPLLLLDDVLSELDPKRRAILADRVRRGSQTLVTSTTAAALPGEPAQLLEVTPGEVRAG